LKAILQCVLLTILAREGFLIVGIWDVKYHAEQVSDFLKTGKGQRCRNKKNNAGSTWSTIPVIKNEEQRKLINQ